MGDSERLKSTLFFSLQAKNDSDVCKSFFWQQNEYSQLLLTIQCSPSRKKGEIWGGFRTWRQNILLYICGALSTNDFCFWKTIYFSHILWKFLVPSLLTHKNYSISRTLYSSVMIQSKSWVYCLHHRLHFPFSKTFTKKEIAWPLNYWNISILFLQNRVVDD